MYKLCLRLGRKQTIRNWSSSWFCPVARQVVRQYTKLGHREVVRQYTKLGHRPFLQYPFQFIIINFSRPKSAAMTKNTHPCGEENLYSPSTRHPNRCLSNNITQRTDPQYPTNLSPKFFFVTKLWKPWLPLIYKIKVLEGIGNVYTSIVTSIKWMLNKKDQYIKKNPNSPQTVFLRNRPIFRNFLDTL